MKFAVIAVRVLLGAGFLFFGLNILLHFLPTPPMAGDVADFNRLMMSHHWMNVVGVLQVVGGLLILVNRFVPLGLVLLGPILVNALLFHMLFMGGAGVAGAAVFSVLWVFLFFVYRRNFLPLFAMNPETELRA